MCPDKSLLSQWFDGELDTEAGKFLKIHVENCRQCRSQIEQWQQQSRMIKSLNAPTDEMAQRIYKKIQTHKNTRKINPFWKKEIPWSYAAGLILLFSLGTLAAGLGFSGRNQASAPLVDIHQWDDSSHFTLNTEVNEDPFSLDQEGDNVVTINLDTSLSYYGESTLLHNASFEGDNF